MEKTVTFLKLFKIENECLKFNRMFFKDFDGALREVPQKRVLLNDIELNKLLKAQRHGEAAVYGDSVKAVMEANGLKDDDEGYGKVIETLAINTKKRRNLEATIGDEDTQKLVAAKFESQSQEMNPRDLLLDKETVPPIIEEEEDE